MKDASFLFRWNLFDPVLDDRKHVSVKLPRMVEQRWMTKARENRIDGTLWIARSIGPCGYDLSDGMTDDNFRETAGWVVEIATEMVF